MAFRILIVDDEKNIRFTLEQCLSGDMVETAQAQNGEEALRKLAESQFDLTLLDIKMPGLTGMETLEKIREAGIHTDVIMMTAYGTVENAVEAMKLGALDFISKPFTPEEIRLLVKQVMDRKVLEENNLTTYGDFLEYAKKCILGKNFDKAEIYLKKAVVENINAAEPHNLFGVIAEYNGDFAVAGKHYRAACALDPTYKPADRNLQRLTDYNYSIRGITLGEEK